MRGHRTLFDLDKRILENNLYGVDLNEEAIEICRLSLWIKTAERGKALTSLDHPIRVGNSVVADPASIPRPSTGKPRFPKFSTQGGFDVVVGNPPYVRQEWLSDYKPYLQSAYKAYHGMADLYVYFYELGLRVLKPGGLLSFIVTNKWMKSGYGEPLRRFFARAAPGSNRSSTSATRSRFSRMPTCSRRSSSPASRPKRRSRRRPGFARSRASNFAIDDLSRQIEAEGVELPLGAARRRRLAA